MKVLAIGLFTLAIASAAAADIPPPRPQEQKPRPRPKPPTQGVTFSIIPAQDGQSVLELPRSLQGTGSPRSEAPGNGRTILAGLFLSLGLVGGGLWAAKRRGPGSVSTAVVLLGGLALGAASTTAWANMAPRFLEEDPKVQVRWAAGPGIRLYVSGSDMRLLNEKYGRQSFRTLPTSPAPGAPPGSGAAGR